MSSRECIVCAKQITAEPTGACTTCNGDLCENCFATHEVCAGGKGMFRGHAFSRMNESECVDILTSAGLTPCLTRCKLHSEPVKLSCTTCGEPSLCILCGLSKHPGHALLVLEEASPVARGLIRDAVATVIAPGKTAVDVARGSALRLAAELDALPCRVGAAEQRIDELRDALFAAAASRHAGLRAELRETAAAVEAALRAELARSDGLVEAATTVSSELNTAAKILSDADVVAHTDALIGRYARIRSTVAALPLRPDTAACVSFGVSASATLEDIATLGRITVAHDVCPSDKRSPSPEARALPVGTGAAASTTSAAVSAIAAAPRPPALPAATQVCNLTVKDCLILFSVQVLL